MNKRIQILTILATSGLSRGDVLVQWLPIAGDATVSEFHNSGQSPSPSLESGGVTASTAARVNQPVIGNVGTVWPGYIANRNGTAGEYDPTTGGYTEFTIIPPAIGEITYETISYQLNSYGGMNDASGYTGVIRSSVDSFATELDRVTITSASSGNFVFDLSTLAATSEEVTFRIYFVDNAGPNTWADLSATNGGLIVNGTVSGTRSEDIIWTGVDSDLWQTNGPDSNWVSPDGFFQAADTVTFDDTADAAFLGTIRVEEVPSPAAVIFNNNTLDYILQGEFASSGSLTKNGTGLLRIEAPDNSFPLSGSVLVNEGTLELAGDSSAFRSATDLAVAPGATFRFAAGNAGQDSSVPITLSGGTLDIDDTTIFLWPPDLASVTLEAGTTSTIDGDGQLFLFGNRISGGGNLIKTGPGLLNATSRTLTTGETALVDILSYTGSTTINGGTLQLGSTSTAASQSWSVSDGAVLSLLSDALLPIENLPNLSTISLTGATLDAVGNQETIASLSMTSSPAAGASFLIVDDLGATLTVTDLNLSGTENYLSFDPAIEASGEYEVLVAENITGVLGTNLSLFGLSPSVQTWNRDATSGLVTVTVDFAAEPNSTLTYTDSSGLSEWSLGLEQDWTDGVNPSQFFNNFTALLDDTAFAAPGTLAVDITGPVSPTGVVFANTTGNNYTIAGSTIGGAGDLVVNGGGIVRFNNTNSYAGQTLISGGSRVTLGTALATPLPTTSAITVSEASTLEIAATNAILRSATDGEISLIGSTLLQSGGNHSQIGDLTLSDGSTWTATSTGSFNGENAQLNGIVFATGSLPSRIGPFTSGIGLNGTLFFDVEDVTADSSPDLVITAQLEDPSAGIGGIDKSLPGTLLLSGANLYTGPTLVREGCLIISGALAIPAGGTGVEVLPDAQFGVVTDSLLDSDIITIANNATWSGGALSFYVAEGSTATFAGDLTGGAFETANAAIVVKGGGTLDFSGASLPVTPSSADGSTITGLSAGGASLIEIVSLVTEPGTASGLKATLTFTADGPVDVYSSTDLLSWGSPIAENLSPGQPFVADDLVSDQTFFVLVSAGTPYPLPN